MLFDGAGWHKAGTLVIPDNIRLVSLPPYAPELNPVEHLWDELREKSFGNIVFDSFDALIKTIWKYHFEKWKQTRKKCFLLSAGHG